MQKDLYMESTASCGTQTTPIVEQAIKPVKTKFVNSEGKIKEYFIRNNPWKFSTSNCFQKQFRFCVICGEDRYIDKTWEGIIGSRMGHAPIICRESSCYQDLAYLSAFVADKFYICDIPPSPRSLEKALENDNFEEVDEVTTLIQFDKVFKDESEMPKDYIDTFKALEEFPVGMRISKIDSIYFKHQEQYDIKVGQWMGDTSDPFLLALSSYRCKSCAVLKEINRSKM
jgi:hypothetical protein